MGTPLWSIGLFIVVSVFSAVATFFIKLASAKISLSFKKIIKNTYLIIGLSVYGVSTILSLVALKAGELSVLYPFISLQYVWANLLSKKYLGEKMCFLKWVGIVLIFVGVSLVGIGAS